ncbi:YceI family protein [Dyadobacter crusticola]|uniref:YceI family protein n=1 Tax=Dyadobacter crusticola TaxID=292407 RepID=UPI0004E12BC7|nr:YceI family protein [Dyadobacter crusticola]
MKTISSIFKARQFLTLTIAAGLLFSCTDHEVAQSEFQLDSSSVAEWKGYLKTGFFNEGSIAVKSESFMIAEGQVKSGSFVIPVSSIVNFNQPTEELRHALVHHLQSPDFFNMVLHPEVKFDITSVEPFTGSGEGTIGGANYKVHGNLTILGNAHPFSFPAKIEVSGDALKLEAFAPFDRTIWGMNYATEPGLPDEASIRPVIDVHLKISGHRK